jgi:hypothetical protein
MSDPRTHEHNGLQASISHQGGPQMLPPEGSEILRVAILSGVIGFAGFCVSYGFYVWRKRNSTHQRQSVGNRRTV